MDKKYIYMAGLLDGEGYIGIAKQIRKNRPSIAYREVFQISNTYEKLMDYLKENFGGTVYVITRDKLMKDVWKVQYVWHCPQSQIKDILKKSLPYLIIKAEQAKIIIEYANRKKSFKRKSLGQGYGSAPLGTKELNFRENIYQRMKTLNARGVMPYDSKNYD